MTEHTDCDLHCPAYLDAKTYGVYCCRGCKDARRAFYEQATSEIKALWNNQTGFLQVGMGCRLPRSQRPKECDEYDCANRIFLTGSARWKDKWPMVIKEVDRATGTEEDFVEQARLVWRDLHDRAVLEEGTGQSSWDEAMSYADGPALYVLHGMMGSGKSSWARKLVIRHPRARIVSADSFRKMIHGQYEYHAEMDDVITRCMSDSIGNLLKSGFDVIVDCGNLTKERREPWLLIAESIKARKVGIILPCLHPSWHISRRVQTPHWEVNWDKIYEDEKAALQPIEEDKDRFDGFIRVAPSEVSARKILILSASPVRDKHIDNLIADKLRKLGHEVKVAPCLRQGRDTILAFRPDICLVPPVRNPNSRDFVEEIKRFGCAVVTRHTEPSCSWQDWKKMDQATKKDILGAFEYKVDLELVWSADEADILSRRRGSPKVISVGAIGLDIYFDEAIKAKMTDFPAFYAKYKFSPEKPTLLISSPWGFADTSPDLSTDDITGARRDAIGRDKHMAMIRSVHQSLAGKWNILLSIHAGIGVGPYAELANELAVPLDADSPMIEMLPHCKALIHAGSTASISAHLLGIPSFQYGDVNAEGVTNWWGVGESPISRVSPRYEAVEGLIEAISACPVGSNANLEVIKELEAGRYGPIDGKACDRAVHYINRLDGTFRYVWPRSVNDYRQLTIQRKESDFYQTMMCNVCHQPFHILTDEFVGQLANRMNVPIERLKPTQGMCCPHCAARMMPVMG